MSAKYKGYQLTITTNAGRSEVFPVSTLTTANRLVQRAIRANPGAFRSFTIVPRTVNSK